MGLSGLDGVLPGEFPFQDRMAGMGDPVVEVSSYQLPVQRLTHTLN
jgi:hypothetical protein